MFNEIWERSCENDQMKKSIKYSGRTFTGLVRRNNQDNMIIDGECLEKEHGDMRIEGDMSLCGHRGLLKRNNPFRRNVIAVFDGMGGEQCGELASYIAASQFAKPCNRINEWDYLSQYIRNADNDINKMSSDKKIRMGTTVAGILIDENKLIAFNVGDSRIYSYYDGRLERISNDHVIYNNGRRYLSQCLGLNEKDFEIAPETREIRYKQGMRYLICTDGLTDMVSEEDILEVMEMEMSLETTADTFEHMVMKRGAVDNTTMIICEV